MFKFGVIVLLLGYSPKAFATDCTTCKGTYETARDASGATAAAKCTALANYLTCLETSAKTDTGCPLATADAAAIETDYGDSTCSGETVFTATCKCQKEFWKTDQSANAAAICSAAKAYILCLKGETAVACDTSATPATLATGVETRMTGLGTTDCAIADTCQCQINTAKATIATGANKCTAYKTELSCLRTAQSTGCDGTTTKSAIATTSDTARAALSASDCPALTSTCQCEVDAAKGAAATSATYCIVLTTLKTCLSAITPTTEVGCASTTQAALLTDTNTKTTSAMCGSVADRVTFAMTSLVVSVLVNMFLYM
ncbi:uncharacterized protein LOC124126174 [Haliotis rufescens]|uniref:uncharacterized protein LOC124126174 n=1 Tax=Haliotis rufescens TaxID=6454 RepID=UPI00201F58AD|nr:uncharacterized protein LOC124126174 [Haliotis rufescens]